MEGGIPGDKEGVREEGVRELRTIERGERGGGGGNCAYLHRRLLYEKITRHPCTQTEPSALFQH